MNEKEIAWAAGFFDGEGCITYPLVNGRRQRYVMVAIKQAVDDPSEPPDVLLRFHRAIGGIGRVGGPYRQTEREGAKGFSTRRRPVYMWYANTESALSVLRLLLPELCRVKADQARAALRTPKVDIREYPEAAGHQWSPFRELADRHMITKT